MLRRCTKKYVYINIRLWINYDFGGQSTSGVNQLMGVKRLFSGVKRLHLLGVKRLGGQTTGITLWSTVS